MINKNEKQSDFKSEIIKTALVGLATSVGSMTISSGTKMIKRKLCTTLVVKENQNGYEEINKAIYELDKEKYEQNRLPTNNSNWFELTINSCYFIKLDSKNYIYIAQELLQERIGYFPSQTRLVFLEIKESNIEKIL